MEFRHIFFCIILLSGSINGIYGNEKDSLEQALQQASQPKDQISILLNLADKEQHNDPDALKKYASKALILAQEHEDQPSSLQALFYLAIALRDQGKFDSCLLVSQQGEQLASSLYQATGNYNHLFSKANIGNIAGSVLRRQGRFEDAVAIYFSALETLDSIPLLDTLVRKLTSERSILYNSIGISYAAGGRTQPAHTYLIKGLKLRQQAGDKPGELYSYTNLGSYWLDARNLDSARWYFNKALELANIFENYPVLLTLYINLSNISFLKGDYVKSLLYTGKTFDLSRQLNRKVNEIFAHMQYAKIFVAQGAYDRAETHANRLLSLADSIGHANGKRSYYEQMSAIYEGRGQYDKALEMYKKLEILNDSIYQVESEKQMADMQVRYETAEKERRLEQQQHRIELLETRERLDLIIRYALIAGVIAVLLLFYLSYRNYRRSKSLARIRLENARLREQELQKEIDYKNRELTSYTLNFIQKNELSQELQQVQRQLQKKGMNEESKSLRRLASQFSGIDNEWSAFKKRFEEVHPRFFVKLKEKFPDVTGNELRLCALIRLNLNLKESAAIMGISPDSVKVARYRLRKKLRLGSEENLHDCLLQLE